MIDTLAVELKFLKENYEYWKSYIAESNSGNMIKSVKLEKIKSRLLELKDVHVGYMLDESSLSRILQHTSGKSAIRSWGSISAERYSNSPEKNKEDTEELKKDIRQMGYGFIPLIGGWRECQDETIPYSKCPPDKLVPKEEESFFIPNLTSKDAETLRNKYNQDAVIYGGPDTEGNAMLLYRDGSVENIGQFNAENAGQVLSRGYSKLRNGRKYVFREKPMSDPRSISHGSTFKKAMSGAGAKEREQAKATVKSLYDDIITNPATNNPVKIKTVLKKGKIHPAYVTAMQYINNKLGRRGTDK